MGITLRLLSLFSTRSSLPFIIIIIINYVIIIYIYIYKYYNDGVMLIDVVAL